MFRLPLSAAHLALSCVTLVMKRKNVFLSLLSASSATGRSKPVVLELFGVFRSVVPFQIFETPVCLLLRTLFRNSSEEQKKSHHFETASDFFIFFSQRTYEGPKKASARGPGAPLRTSDRNSFIDWPILKKHSLMRNTKDWNLRTIGTKQVRGKLTNLWFFSMSYVVTILATKLLVWSCQLACEVIKTFLVKFQPNSIKQNASCVRLAKFLRNFPPAMSIKCEAHITFFKTQTSE